MIFTEVRATRCLISGRLQFVRERPARCVPSAEDVQRLTGPGHQKRDELVDEGTSQLRVPLELGAAALWNPANLRAMI